MDQMDGQVGVTMGRLGECRLLRREDLELEVGLV